MQSVLAFFRSLVVLAIVLAMPSLAIFSAYHKESESPPRLSPPAMIAAGSGRSDAARRNKTRRDSAPLYPIARVATHPVSANPEEMRQLAEMRRQLESLGAEYVLLESTERAGFRFYCRVPIRNTPYVKAFEVRHREPLHAMRAGVDHVTRWIDGQRVAGMNIASKP